MKWDVGIYQIVNILEWEVGWAEVGCGTQTRILIFKSLSSEHITCPAGAGGATRPVLMGGAKSGVELLTRCCRTHFYVLFN